MIFHPFCFGKAPFVAKAPHLPRPGRRGTFRRRPAGLHKISHLNPASAGVIPRYPTLSRIKKYRTAEKIGKGHFSFRNTFFLEYCAFSPFRCLPTNFPL